MINQTGTFRLRHTVKSFQQHSQAGVLPEETAVHMHKPPEQGIPGLLPCSFFEITHFENVITATDVGLCGKYTSIGKLAHAVNIGHHNPIPCINKKLHKPLINLIGIEFAQKHEVADNHKTLNMMAVSGFKHLFYNLVYRFNTRLGCVKTLQVFFC